MAGNPRFGYLTAVKEFLLIYIADDNDESGHFANCVLKKLYHAVSWDAAEYCLTGLHPALFP